MDKRVRDRHGKKRTERPDTPEEIKKQKILENEIPKDCFDPVLKDGIWFKRCKFCNRVFALRTTKRTQEKYCSTKCKTAQECSTKRHTFVCTNCGKEFSRNWDKHQEYNFCCSECALEFQAREKRPPDKICEFCGNSFKPKYPRQRFCCISCQNKWQSVVFKGEGNPHYRKDISLEERTRICPICGKQFVAKNATLATRQIYCSMKCKRKGFRDSKIQQEMVAEVRKIFPEAEEEHVEYPFSFDCFVSPNFVVEMMGDYWHCNPTVYNKEEWDPIQKRAFIKDSRKRKFLRDGNYNFLYIWENDWRENKEKCLFLIKILFEGVLENPDSFNYIEDKNGKFVLSSDLIDFYSGEND